MNWWNTCLFSIERAFEHFWWKNWLISSALINAITTPQCSLWMFMMMFIANSLDTCVGFVAPHFFFSIGKLWWAVRMSALSLCILYRQTHKEWTEMKGIIEPQRVSNGFCAFFHIFEMRGSNGWLISSLLWHSNYTRHWSIDIWRVWANWEPFWRGFPIDFVHFVITRVKVFIWNLNSPCAHILHILFKHLTYEYFTAITDYQIQLMEQKNPPLDIWCENKILMDIERCSFEKKIFFIWKRQVLAFKLPESYVLIGKLAMMLP